MAAEVPGNGALKAEELFKLRVVLDDLVTASLEVVDERALAVQVVVADCPRQEVRAVFRRAERTLK